MADLKHRRRLASAVAPLLAVFAVLFAVSGAVAQQTASPQPPAGAAFPPPPDQPPPPASQAGPPSAAATAPEEAAPSNGTDDTANDGLRPSTASRSPMDLGVEQPQSTPDDAATLPAEQSAPADTSQPAEQRDIAHPGGTVAVLRGLNKITARVTVIDAPVGKPVMFGKLKIVADYCYKHPPEESPEVSAFLQIDDTRVADPKKSRIFSGWMFASSPALNAMEHPVYDVWLIDCKTSAPDSDFGSVPNTPTLKEDEIKRLP